MKVLIILLILGVFLTGSGISAQDILIDEDGDITTGTSNSYGNLKVKGASGEHAIVGEATGTGTAGIYGKSLDSNNFGALGSDQYGVYGNSSSGYAGYFQGNVSITGSLSAGTLTGESDPTVNQSIKDGVDWTELSGIPAGFADGVDNTGDSSIWSQNGTYLYYNSGNIGIGTTTPAGRLDVIGDICLSGVCRTTWPTGSGTGAFIDSGSYAYYTGGDVGIGTTSPTGIFNVDNRVLHIVHTPAPSGDSAVGLRLEIDGIIDAGIMSAYNPAKSAGLFVGTLSSHRTALGTNGIEYLTVETDGNVGIKNSLGIGTAGPLQPLHVQGNAYVSSKLGIGVDSPANNLQVSGSSTLFSSDTGDFRLSISKKLTSDISSILFADNFSGHAELGLTYDDNFHIKVSPDGTTFNDAMIIDNATGNVGINTSDLSYKLHIIGEDNNAIWAESTSVLPTMHVVQNGTGVSMRIVNNNGASAAMYIIQRGSAEALLVKNSTSDIMHLDSSGNLGLGTSTPQSTLQVNGYAQLALTSGAPPAADCNDASERGRMKVDNAAGLLYICVDTGWVSK